MAKLLVVDNQRNTRVNLKEILEVEKYDVLSCESAEECKRIILKTKFDLIVYNACLPDMDGEAFMNFINNKNIETTVIMTIDKSDMELIIKCVRNGTYDFIEKPFNINRLLMTIRNALGNKKLKIECKKLHKRVVATIPEIIGESEQIKAIKKMIERVSKSDARVFITGPNGTGKELVARWLHELSDRRSSPIIEVNCAAIPNELIESELFGHEKGSFTSAVSQHIGKFELANEGTLFLDEIGDMSLSAQAKMLRVLQENRLTRVGGNKEIEVNVRVVAATNKNIKEEIIKGNFREDLFHRLNVIPIHVPSLAERNTDIPILIDKFIEILSERRGEPKKQITPEAMDMLQKRGWPGNIRELQNVIERLVILSDDKITTKDVEAYCCC